MSSKLPLAFLKNTTETIVAKEAWKILIVDDDKDVHYVTKTVLSRLTFEKKRINFLSALNGDEAKKILRSHFDIALILLDVVMEDDDTGLMLSKFIRDELNNPYVRIVLRTGQPGHAPERKVIEEYDINDYKEKTELTSDKLFTTVISSLRNYRDLMLVESKRKIIEQNRLGLKQIIKSSGSLFKMRSFKEFSQGVLLQLASILKIYNNRLYISAGYCQNKKEEYWKILASTGKYGSLKDKQPIPQEIEKYLELALNKGQSIFIDDVYVGYFENHLGYTNLLYFDGCAEINDSDRQLVEIFSTIVSIVFENIYLDNKIIQSQKEQQEILNTMIEGVITIDERGKILSFNQAAEKLFDYLAEEVIGQKINMLMPEPFAHQHDSYLQSYLETDIPHIIGFGREVKALHKNGTTFPIHLAVAELPRDSKGRRRFVGSCEDLVVQKQQEEQIRRSQKMDALGKLTGGIAHDYNNMLGVIIGYTDLLGKKVGHNPDANRYLTHIREATERSKNMTGKLLRFSRKKSIDAQRVNINEVIKNDEEMLAKSLTVRIELQLKLCDSSWTVWLDQSELQDMLINMSINAQHAMPDGGRLSIKTATKTLSNSEGVMLGLAAGDYMLLSITDTGIGMDDTTQEKIFDPFFTTKGDKGTGLGLSQVFGFVERSGGTISVNSILARGTRFEIYFPRNQTIESIRKTKKLKDFEDYSGQETLLVVDDEPALRMMVSDHLLGFGYQVLLAEGGEQALEVLATHDDIALMLCDVIMPKMDGFELAEQVAKLYPHIKIQMVSGFTDFRHSDKVDKTLINHLLYKPYSPDELLKRIRYLLDNA